MAQDTVLSDPRPKQKLRRAAGSIAVLIAIAGAGCTGTNPRRIAAEKIAEALPTVIGPAKHYDVDVEGNAFSLARGHASRVTIDGQDVRVAPSLTMNELHIDAQDLALDTKTRKVRHAGHVAFTGVVGQIRLDDYLAGMKSGIKGLSVKIRWTDVDASVPVTALGMTTTVRVDGTLAPSSAGPDKLDFVPEGGAIGAVPVPTRLVRIAMDRMNPVLDLGGLKFPVAVESARVDNGRIYVIGTATLTAQ